MILGLLAGALLVVGCGKNAPSTETPGDAGAAEAGDSAEPVRIDSDDLSDYELELDAYEEDMLSAGYELPGLAVEARAAQGKVSTAASSAGADLVGPRCERICGLSASICGLGERICALSDQHDREPRYARACERATLDCERATEACEGCED